jgi:hypothetical protein
MKRKIMFNDGGNLNGLLPESMVRVSGLLFWYGEIGNLLEKRGTMETYNVV